MRMLCFAALLTLTWSVVGIAEPLGSEFTYQGNLVQQGSPANGDYDFQFLVYDVDMGGIPLTAAVIKEDVPVSDGIFTTEVDFGLAPFAGDKLWLEIYVREGSSTGGYAGLLPRQKIAAVPYALHAEFVPMSSIGAAEINPSEVQTRVSESCDPGSAIQAIGAAGTVTCGAVDNDIDSSNEIQSLSYAGSTLTISGGNSVTVPNGDITGITTSASSGLNGGTTSGTATLSVDPTDFMEPIQGTRGSGCDYITNTTGTTILSDSLTAPISGTVLVITAGDIRCSSCTETESVRVEGTVSTLSTADPGTGYYFQRNLEGSDMNYQGAHNIAVFSVSPGTTTFYWRVGLTTASSESAQLCRPRMASIFIPN